MAELDNKELVRSFFEKACVLRDRDAASEFVSEDYVMHNPMAPDFPGGREAFKDMCKGSDAIKDMSCSIEDQFAEGDRVVTRWKVSGCQVKDLPDIPSKGLCFKMDGITISRVADGKVAEEWVSMDALGMRKQLGCS
jgi:predicted ester cyclase